MKTMNLLRMLARVSSMTMLSRILGFVRDAIIARYFGAGLATDCFNVAFRLPNLLRRIFAEGAFSQAFVPVLAEYKNQRGETATRILVADVAGVLSAILALVSILGVVAAPWVIYLTAHGLTEKPGGFELATSLLRITFPYIFLISLASLVGSVLNTYNRFTVPAVTPTLFNVASILCALFLAPHLDIPIHALAWGTLLGGVMQLGFQLPFLHKVGMLVWPRLAWKDPAVWRIIKQMAPLMFSVSVAQISLVINTQFASALREGSVSWMYYADRLMELPSGVLGAALGTILLPSLAKLHAKDDSSEYSAMLDWGLRLCLLLSLPAAVALAVLAYPLIGSLFQYGKFGDFDASMTAQALIAYSIGLLGLIAVKILAPGFYARQDTRTPVKIAVITLICTQLMNLLFYKPLAHAGLSLSIGLAATLNAYLLLRALRKQNIYQPSAGWFGFLAKLLFAVVVMAIVLWFGAHWLGSWQTGAMWLRCSKLLGLCAAGAGIYFACLGLCGFRPRDFSRRATS
ncbi:murein biosynthesis integral membrane protein MurJ [Chitinimonas sp. DQS-5]|uniref:Probable lipid II flippase MurJ n=2 Tax=Parachitinimonas caeni TaxID=3031301 RepID=A0ABT7DUV0_9NEIS|nr:murein biosynthesis integral membrane protein MurJ [Parachitinimonas caeni]